MKCITVYSVYDRAIGQARVFVLDDNEKIEFYGFENAYQTSSILSKWLKVPVYTVLATKTHFLKHFPSQKVVFDTK